MLSNEYKKGCILLKASEESKLKILISKIQSILFGYLKVQIVQVNTDYMNLDS